MERNYIEIRHGQNPPKAGDLEPYELGFCENTEALYIGASEENEPPILITKSGEGGGGNTPVADAVFRSRVYGTCQGARGDVSCR